MRVLFNGGTAAFQVMQKCVLMACRQRQGWRGEGEQFARSNIQRYATGVHYDLASRDEACGCR